MKKTFKIISICVGVISALSALVLGCIYFESISEYIKEKTSREKIKE